MLRFEAFGGSFHNITATNACGGSTVVCCVVLVREGLLEGRSGEEESEILRVESSVRAGSVAVILAVAVDMVGYCARNCLNEM